MIPPWYLDAVARMKATRRHGIAMVVPDGEPDRTEFADAWMVLLDSPDPDIREVLAEAVFYALGTEVAKDTVRRPGETANWILITPDAKVLSGDFVNYRSVLQPERFVRTCRKLLHGKDDVRLKAAADAIWAELSPAERKSLEEHDDGIYDLAPNVIPWLVWRRITAHDERAAAAITRLFLKRGPDAPVGMEKQGAWIDPCLGCGMASAPRASRRFLSYLSPRSNAETPGFWSETI